VLQICPACRLFRVNSTCAEPAFVYEGAAVRQQNTSIAAVLSTGKDLPAISKCTERADAILVGITEIRCSRWPAAEVESIVWTTDATARHSNAPQLAENAFQSFADSLRLDSIKGGDSAFLLDEGFPEGIYLG
jgi:hypothetical protein